MSEGVLLIGWDDDDDDNNNNVLFLHSTTSYGKCSLCLFVCLRLYVSTTIMNNNFKCHCIPSENELFAYITTNKHYYSKYIKGLRFPS